MTLIEILKARGIGDEIIKAVQEDMKTNKIFTSSEENMDIRYGKLKTDHDGVKKQLDEANKLIEDMKKSTKDNEGLQGKITTYEKQVEDLTKQLKAAKIEAAIKVGLLSEKAIDVDYLTYKLRETGELDLDENGKIKGWDEKIASLKTKLPAQFAGPGSKKFEENKLPDKRDDDNGNEPKTLEEALRMQYEDGK